jgi:glycosyltransferase involved in cell wall biosynthesis
VAGRTALENTYGRQMDIHVLPHAMYAAVPSRKSREEMRRELDIRPEHTVLMLLGTNKAYKGFGEFIEALRDVDTDGITVFCAGEDMASLASRCEAVGVEYRIRDGHQSSEELATCIAAADYGVVPYRRILHSGTAVFFLSHGCPVIAPAIGVFPEYLGAYAIGILYRAGDASSLASVLADARQRGRDGYMDEIRRFSDDHTVADAAKQLAAVYMGLRSQE